MKKFLFWLLMLILGFVLPLGSMEIFLRATHFQFNYYWRPFVHSRNDPTVNQFDPVLGWRPRPGKYTIPAYSPDSSDIPMTVLPDGSRPTALQRISKDRSIVAIGCSLTQGWAISDDETMYWQLQQRHPDIGIINLGVVGYSTYQSLLLLEEYLKDGKQKPSAVVYGFISHDPLRNVASYKWLLILSHLSNRGVVALPYCLMDHKSGEEELECFPPEAYPRWWGDRFSYLVGFLKDAFLDLNNFRRVKDAKPVTEKLFLRMKNFCENQGIRFYVVMFQLSDERETKYYENFFKESGIRYVNCVDPRENLPGMKVAREGHPNAAMNTIWANCIESRVRAELN